MKKLIPTSIIVLNTDYMAIGHQEENINRSTLSMSFDIEVIGFGDFSEYVIDGKLQSDKIVLAILNGEIDITRKI